MKGLSKTFFTGLVAILPVAITFYVLIKLASWAESILGTGIKLVLPPGLYHVGMGLISGILLIFLLGVLMRVFVVRRLFAWGEAILGRIPLVKVIFGSVHDLMGFFSGSQTRGFSQVVLVNLGHANLSALGFVTRENVAGFPPEMGGEDAVVVYIPLSYQIGGHMLVVPRTAIKPLSMSMQDAMRFAITAGITSGVPS
ncbi:MAG: DUF502 domain-containing protein [Acidiferrobacterales bacterium]